MIWLYLSCESSEVHGADQLQGRAWELNLSYTTAGD